MKKLVLIAASAAVLAASPAFARSAEHQISRAPEAHDRAQAGPAAAQRDPDDVYLNGRLVGRDPDPNVREELRTVAGHGWW
jgi:hypothetical protein